jgi:hypothetical protein
MNCSSPRGTRGEVPEGRWGVSARAIVQAVTPPPGFAVLPHHFVTRERDLTLTCPHQTLLIAVSTFDG